MSKNYTETLPNGTAFELVFVEGGEQTLKFRNWDDGKQGELQVNIPSFYIAQVPVTQALWENVMGENPSYFKGANHPVENVSWDDVQAFLEQLNALLGIAPNATPRYRLPSEVQWQYAAMGGQQSKGFEYAGSHNLKEVGWYDTNSHSETKPVGLKKANELGLYDMSGNVWEWCADEWQEDITKVPKDGSPAKGDDSRFVVRGGSWYYDDYYCTVSFRDWFNSIGRYDLIGFRVSRY